MWDYICYLSYLQEKEESDFDGVEGYVWDMYQEKSIDWIPQMRALSLTADKKEKRNLDYLEQVYNEVSSKFEFFGFLNFFWFLMSCGGRDACWWFFVGCSGFLRVFERLFVDFFGFD